MLVRRSPPKNRFTEKEYEQQLALKAYTDSLELKLSVQAAAAELQRSELAALLGRRAWGQVRACAFRVWREITLAGKTRKGSVCTMCPLHCPASSKKCGHQNIQVAPDTSRELTDDQGTLRQRCMGTQPLRTRCEQNYSSNLKRIRDANTMRCAVLLCSFMGGAVLQRILSAWRLSIDRKRQALCHLRTTTSVSSLQVSLRDAYSAWRIHLFFRSWQAVAAYSHVNRYSGFTLKPSRLHARQERALVVKSWLLWCNLLYPVRPSTVASRDRTCVEVHSLGRPEGKQSPADVAVFKAALQIVSSHRRRDIGLAFVAWRHHAQRSLWSSHAAAIFARFRSTALMIEVLRAWRGAVVLAAIPLPGRSNGSPKHDRRLAKNMDLALGSTTSTGDNFTALQTSQRELAEVAIDGAGELIVNNEEFSFGLQPDNYAEDREMLEEDRMGIVEAMALAASAQRLLEVKRHDDIQVDLARADDESERFSHAGSLRSDTPCIHEADAASSVAGLPQFSRFHSSSQERGNLRNRCMAHLPNTTSVVSLGASILPPLETEDSLVWLHLIRGYLQHALIFVVFRAWQKQRLAGANIRACKQELKVSAGRIFERANRLRDDALLSAVYLAWFLVFSDSHHCCQARHRVALREKARLEQDNLALLHTLCWAWHILVSMAFCSRKARDQATDLENRALCQTAYWGWRSLTSDARHSREAALGRRACAQHACCHASALLHTRFVKGLAQRSWDAWLWACMSEISNRQLLARDDQLELVATQATETLRTMKQWMLIVMLLHSWQHLATAARQAGGRQQLRTELDEAVVKAQRQNQKTHLQVSAVGVIQDRRYTLTLAFHRWLFGLCHAATSRKLCRRLNLQDQKHRVAEVFLHWSTSVQRWVHCAREVSLQEAGADILAQREEHLQTVTSQVAATLRALKQSVALQSSFQAWHRTCARSRHRRQAEVLQEGLEGHLQETSLQIRARWEFFWERRLVALQQSQKAVLAGRCLSAWRLAYQKPLYDSLKTDRDSLAKLVQRRDLQLFGLFSHHFPQAVSAPFTLLSLLVCRLCVVAWNGLVNMSRLCTGFLGRAKQTCDAVVCAARTWRAWVHITMNTRHQLELKTIEQNCACKMFSHSSEMDALRVAVRIWREHALQLVHDRVTAAVLSQVAPRARAQATRSRHSACKLLMLKLAHWAMAGCFRGWCLVLSFEACRLCSARRLEEHRSALLLRKMLCSWICFWTAARSWLGLQRRAQKAGLAAEEHAAAVLWSWAFRLRARMMRARVARRMRDCCQVDKLPAGVRSSSAPSLQSVIESVVLEALATCALAAWHHATFSIRSLGKAGNSARTATSPAPGRVENHAHAFSSMDCRELMVLCTTLELQNADLEAVLCAGKRENDLLEATLCRADGQELPTVLTAVAESAYARMLH